MTFEEILDQALAMLQRRGRVSYRALKLQFTLDDDQLEALTDELLYAHPQVVDGLLALARQIGDRTTEGGALAGMGFASLWAHDFGPALAYSRRAIEVAEAVDAKPVLALGHFTTGWVHTVCGRLEPGRKEVDHAIRISQSSGDMFLLSLSLSMAGQFDTWAGACAAAERLQAESLRIARDHNLLVPLLLSLFSNGLTLTTKGDYDGGLAMFEEGVALSEKVGDEVWHHRFLNCLGWLYIEVGNLDRALDLNRLGAEGARKRGDPETIANAEINLGDVFIAKADLTLAQEVLDGVYRLAHDPATSEWQRWRYSIHLFASLGELWLARGDPAKAWEFAERCLESATSTNSQKYLVKGYRLKGEIALVRRQWDEAEGALRQALTIAQAIGNSSQLWKTHLALGRLQAETKRRELAQRSLQAAREVIDQIKGRLQNPVLRASLEHSPVIQHIYDL